MLVILFTWLGFFVVFLLLLFLFLSALTVEKVVSSYVTKTTAFILDKSLGPMLSMLSEDLRLLQQLEFLAESYEPNFGLRQ